MEWQGIGFLALLGLWLVTFPRSLFRDNGDAARAAQLTRGFQGAGAVLLHLAALAAVFRLVSSE